MGKDLIIKMLQLQLEAANAANVHWLLAKSANFFDKLYETMCKAVKEGRYLNCDRPRVLLLR